MNSRFLIRVGNDHKVIDELLTPNLEQRDPIAIDGVVVEATKSQFFLSLRERLPATSQVLMDPEVHRLQHDSCLSNQSLQKLSYAPTERPYSPADFVDPRPRKQFIQHVFDLQHKARVTDYLAPAFYLDSPDSPWREINRDLLKDSVAQVGSQVHATVCGGNFLLTDEGLVNEVARSGATGVYLLTSPSTPTADSTSKLVDYVELVKKLSSSGLNVVAGRQPAFGLALMAMGIASFESGVAQGEKFNYRSLVKAKKPAENGKSKGGGTSRGVYFSDMMTTLPHGKAARLLEIPAVRGLLVCDELCCRHNFSRLLLKPRDHFLWARVKEVEGLRKEPSGWRVRNLIDRINRASTIGEKAHRMLPNAKIPMAHLSKWERVIEVTAGSLQTGGRRNG